MTAKGQGVVVVDCASIVNSGCPPSTYSHEYDGYLAFFAMLGHATDAVQCWNVPASWAPLVAYLGHDVKSVRRHHGPGWDCESVDWLAAYKAAFDEVSGDPRRVVEISSTCRPELVHALYLVDTAWPCVFRVRGASPHCIPVTCNGSFFRDEIREFRSMLRAYEPRYRNVVLVPCAADKPYPAPVHVAVREIIGHRPFYIAVATGVLGLVPDSEWDSMPLYDSGIPNLHRVEDTVSWYFTRHDHARIVVFSDFYAHAIANGLSRVRGLGADVTYILGNHYRDTYENLLLPEHLNALDRAISAEAA